MERKRGRPKGSKNKRLINVNFPKTYMAEFPMEDNSFIAQFERMFQTFTGSVEKACLNFRTALIAICSMQMVIIILLILNLFKK